jgi:hypothetical protein
MVRFLLRSPLLWIGVLVATYISWLWFKSTAKPTGFGYSRSGQYIKVVAGGERFSMAGGSGSGWGPGFVSGEPEVYLMTLCAGLGKPGLVKFAFTSGGGRPGWGGSISISFPALLAAYLAVWYGFLGWRVWRYYRRNAVPADMGSG